MEALEWGLTPLQLSLIMSGCNLFPIQSRLVRNFVWIQKILFLITILHVVYQSISTDFEVIFCVDNLINAIGILVTMDVITSRSNDILIFLQQMSPALKNDHDDLCIFSVGLLLFRMIQMIVTFITALNFNAAITSFDINTCTWQQP